MRASIRTILLSIAVLAAGAIGLGAGYVLWGWPRDWYAPLDLAALPHDEAGDLVRYGRAILTDTARHIGRSAENPALRLAGNDLACANCHLKAGLQPFAAPLVSTFATYPLMANDAVVTLPERINGCMTRSMNGSPMPEGSREMQALVAYMQFLGRDTPVGVRVAGMGLLPLADPAETPDAARGEAVYERYCTTCHGPQGEGRRRSDRGADGYDVPPLWGADSFNAAAGMADIRMAAAFIHANMPAPVAYPGSILTPQQAWDVAAFVTSRERPPAPDGR